VVPSAMKGKVLHPLLLQRKAPGILGGSLRCVALTRMTRRMLHQRYNMRGGKGNAALHRCEELRMFRLFLIIRRTVFSRLNAGGVNLKLGPVIQCSRGKEQYVRETKRQIWGTQTRNRKSHHTTSH